MALALPAAAASAGPVDLMVGQGLAAGPLGCGESSAPIEFVATRSNSVAKGRGRPDAQYVLGMRLRATPLPRSGDGELTVFGEVGGEPGATLELRRDVEDGRPVLRWSSIDLIHGTRTGTVPNGGAELSTSNYIPFGTVEAGGGNRLRFRVRCSGVTPIAAVAVLGSTRLRETTREPAHLRLSTPAAGADPEVGTALTIPFRIVNSGDVPAVDVEVHPLVPERRAQLVGRTRYLFKELDGGRSGRFLVIPRRRGRIGIELVTSSGNSNQPAVRLGGMAGKPRLDSGSVASPWLGVAGISAIGAAALLLSRRRRVRAERR